MTEKKDARMRFDEELFSYEFVPNALFDELMRLYGTDELFEFQKYKVFCLDVEKAGCEGCVGITSNKHNSTLMIWNADPREEVCSCDISCLYLLCVYDNPIEQYLNNEKEVRFEIKSKLFGGGFFCPNSIVCPFVLFVASRVAEMLEKKNFLPGKVFER